MLHKAVKRKNLIDLLLKTFFLNELLPAFNQGVSTCVCVYVPKLFGLTVVAADFLFPLLLREQNGRLSCKGPNLFPISLSPSHLHVHRHTS